MRRMHRRSIAARVRKVLRSQFPHQHGARHCYQRWGADGKVRQLNELYNAHSKSPSATVQFGRLTLSGVTPPELLELCAEQFLFRCRPVSAPAS